MVFSMANPIGCTLDTLPCADLRIAQIFKSPVLASNMLPELQVSGCLPWKFGAKNQSMDWINVDNENPWDCEKKNYNIPAGYLT
jgi:hypothetical protein